MNDRRDAPRRTESQSCPDHPGALEALAEAEGLRLPLPDPAPGCALCEANHHRYRAVQRLLRTSEATVAHDGPLLSPSWQADVWLRLGREAADAPAADLPAGRVVPFLRAAPAPTDLPAPKPPQATSPEAAPATQGEVPRRGRARWVWAAAAAALLAVGASALVLALAEEPATAPSPLATQWRGEHMVQPDNPPPRPLPPAAAAVAKAAPAQVKLRAYTMDVLNEAEPASTLRDGSTIASGALLSFDYSIQGGEIGEDMRYLTVVAVLQSQRAQEQALPEGKQLLWLVESRPIRDTGGELSVLEEDDVQVNAPPGELTIFGIFSREPVPGQAIEDALLLQSAAPSALPGIGMARLDLRVEAAAEP